MQSKRALAVSATALGLCAGAVATPPARGACSAIPRSECRRVTVPLDRTGALAGRLSLFTVTVHGRHPAAAPVLVLAGGPGNSLTSTEKLHSLLDALGGEVLRRRDVVVLDARGTGRSKPVGKPEPFMKCAELQGQLLPRSMDKAAHCAQAVGPRRAFYRTDDQIEDIDAVRTSLGFARLTLFATSYGTKVALGYARAHPDRVDRLLLDSVVPTSGPSALSLDTLAAMPHALNDICGVLCRADGRPLANDAAAVVRALRQQPVAATIYDRGGRAHRERLDPLGFWDMLLAGDSEPALRAAEAAAIRAARAGDPALLLRLARAARLVLHPPHPPPARMFSTGLYTATSCEDVALPWDPAASSGQRRAQAAARAGALGEAAFFPFDSQTVLAAAYVSLCARWPASPRPPAPPPAPLPAVPMLLLAGSQDLRTPVEGARATAREALNARTLIVPGGGHALVTEGASACALRAASAFLLRRPTPAHCPRMTPAVTPVPVPPRSLDRLRRVPGIPGRAGRTLRAVDLTLDDAALALALDARAAAGGGLRGGYYRAQGRGISLAKVQYVAGVRVDGRPAADGALTLSISGRNAARGTLTLSRSGTVRGRLGRTRIRARLVAGPRTGTFSASASIASAARSPPSRPPAAAAGGGGQRDPLRTRYPRCSQAANVRQS